MERGTVGAANETKKGESCIRMRTKRSGDLEFDKEGTITFGRCCSCVKKLEAWVLPIGLEEFCGQLEVTLDGLDFGESETEGTGHSESVDSFKEFYCKGKRRKEGIDEG